MPTINCPHRVLFVCDRGDASQYHVGFKSRELGQAPMRQVFLMDCIGCRIKIVCLIGTLSTILQHFTCNMKPSDPLLLLDCTLRYRKYPAGKVAIFRHLATPRIPQCDDTVINLNLRTLVHCILKYSRPPDLKSSSYVSLPLA